MALLHRLASGLQAVTQGQRGFATPDVPRAQQIALGQAIFAVLVVLGVDLDTGTKQLILVLSAALATALPASDAAVRRARAKHAAELQQAQAKAGNVASSWALDEDARLRIAELETELSRRR